ncbi:agmatine deiminase family protein [Streptomyces lusitanus]
MTTVPVFVEDGGELLGVDFNFNGWGNKQEHTNDAQVGRLLLRKYGIPREQAPLVAEGGSFETDGEGTLLVTESSIVNDNRNRGKTRDQIEDELIETLGVEKVVWLAGVRGEDITDAHVDSLVRFTAPGVVLLDQAFPGSPADSWSRSADQARSVLEKATDAQGRRFEIVDLPQPDLDRITGEGDDFVSTYANFYVANDSVFMPKFGDRRADDRARGILQEHFPKRDVVQIQIDTIASGGGGIHCATTSSPASPPPDPPLPFRPLPSPPPPECGRVPEATSSTGPGGPLSTALVLLAVAAAALCGLWLQFGERQDLDTRYTAGGQAPDRIDIDASVQRVDAAGRELVLRVLVTPRGALAEAGGVSPAEDLTLQTSSSVRGDLTFPAHSRIATVDVPVALTGGAITDYPFDAYEAEMEFGAVQGGESVPVRMTLVNRGRPVLPGRGHLGDPRCRRVRRGGGAVPERPRLLRVHDAGDVGARRSGADGRLAPGAPAYGADLAGARLDGGHAVRPGRLPQHRPGRAAHRQPARLSGVLLGRDAHRVLCDRRGRPGRTVGGPAAPARRDRPVTPPDGPAVCPTWAAPAWTAECSATGTPRAAP